MTSSTTRPTARYRPVSVPEDVDDPSIVKASGRVVLPLHVRWSGHKVYDLDNLQHRKLVYEQVLAEGLDEDVRRFIEVDELVALWEEMMLPSFVRDAWGPWLRQRGLLH